MRAKVMVALWLVGCVPPEEELGGDENGWGADDGGVGSGDGGGGGDDGGHEHDGGDSDGGGDTGWGGEIAFSSYSGWEQFNLARGQRDPGELNCQIVWDVSGEGVPSCTNCDFTFSMTGVVNTEYTWLDDSGVCDGADVGWAREYGYAVDYYGLGNYLMYAYQGHWYAIWPAEFDGTTFTYAGGEVDYFYDGTYGYYPQYAGAYATNFRYGSGTVSE